MVNEDLSPSLSLIAFKDKQPIGIVLYGVRKDKPKTQDYFLQNEALHDKSALRDGNIFML